MAPVAMGNTTKPTLLTMDVIELTLLLKSIGFRLNSIDFDEQHFAGKMNGNGTRSAGTSPTNQQAAGEHFINVQISCSQSKIVSNLSLNMGAEHNAMDAASIDPNKCAACTCPKREQRENNNSFWEVQSTGTFANRRRSMNTLLMDSEKGIENDTSSNLLPTLSAKSIALTQVLTQLVLNQYKSNSMHGEQGSVKNFDVGSVMRAINYGDSNSQAECDNKIRRFSKYASSIQEHSTIPKATHGSDVSAIEQYIKSTGKADNRQQTEIETNASDSSNVDVPKLLLPPITLCGDAGADGLPKLVALNETVNTEAFSSPKSEMFTSSPNSSNSTNAERDANLINNLNRARHHIDSALLMMKLNVTQNFAQQNPTELLTVTPLNLKRVPTIGLTNEKLPADRTVSKTGAIVRRASVSGRIGPIISSTASRVNSTGINKNSIERGSSLSRVASVRRSISGISLRQKTVSIDAKVSPVVTNTSSTRSAAAQKIQRRTSSPGMLTANVSSSTRPPLRRTIGLIKPTTIPSKLVKK